MSSFPFLSKLEYTTLMSVWSLILSNHHCSPSSIKCALRPSDSLFLAGTVSMRSQMYLDASVLICPNTWLINSGSMCSSTSFENTQSYVKTYLY